MPRKVIWHEPTRRWVMAVARPHERKVRFYASHDLKAWTHLSDFGPAGATGGIWECPDLFPLPVDHPGGETRWVLIVNLNPGGPAGGSGCQYFPGEFDGRRFTVDPSFPEAPASAEDRAPKGAVLADFEETGFAGWTAEGAAFAAGPVRPSGGEISGFLGRGLADSFGRGDRDQGTLTSPEFPIEAGWLSFLVGGGGHADETGVSLLVDGVAVRTESGPGGPRLRWASWDVGELRGRNGRIRIHRMGSAR